MIDTRGDASWVQPGLTGRTAFITGGTRGIGREVARRLLESGARVVIAGRDVEVGEAGAKELSDYGDVKFVQADVCRREEVEALVDQTVEHFGRLDIAVLNGVSDAPCATWSRSGRGVSWRCRPWRASMARLVSLDM